MRRTVVLLLLACLGAAVVGAAVTGLFSLALISLALLLGAGAVGLTLQRPRGEGTYAPSSRREEAAVIELGSRRRAQGGGEARRAA